MLTFRILVALLAFGGFGVHVVFLVRAHRDRDYRGWRLRILRLVVSFCFSTGFAGVILLPDGWLSWAAVAVVAACSIAEIRFAVNERASGALTGGSAAPR